jgi:hypothetical protein
MAGFSGGEHVWSKTVAVRVEDIAERNGVTYATGSGSWQTYQPNPTIISYGNSGGAVFLVRLDEDGEPVWVFQGSGSTGQSVATTPDGGAVICGRSGNGGIDFGAGPVAESNYGGFAARLGPDGAHRWSRGFDQSTGIRFLAGIAVSPNESVFLSGRTQDDAVFGTPVDSPYGSGAFVAKLSDSGAALWAKVLPTGSNGADARADAVLATADGGCVLAGSIPSPVNLGSGPLGREGRTSAVFARFDSDGNLLWSRDIQGEGDVLPTSADLAPDGSILVLGEFTGRIDFGRGVEISRGEKDIFLMKLRP